jgi:hypothetical protein
MLRPGVAQAGEAGVEPVLGPSSVEEPDDVTGGDGAYFGVTLSNKKTTISYWIL